MEVREPNARYLTAIQHTELGEFPADWQVVPLDEFDPFITSGSRGWAAHYADVGSTFLRITNLSRSCIYPSLRDLRYVAVPPDNSEGVRTALRAGDVLISITADIGIVGLVTEAVELPAYINQHIALVRFDESEVNSRYIAYFLAGAAAQRRFKSMTDAGAKAGMNLAGVRDVLAALPPSRDEQTAIADALTDADGLIDSLEQLLTKKRQIKQGAMQELLTGKRRLPGLARPWATRKLGEIATITMGRTPARLVGSFWGIGHKWLSIADLKGKVIAESKEEITDAGAEGVEQIPEGTLLMSFKLTIGRLAFAGCKLYTNEAICALRNPKVDKELLYYALSRVDFSLFGKQAVKGYTLNKESLRNVEVLLPSDPMEQRAIAQVLADQDTEIESLESRLTKARALKQAMAQALLTGRIRLVKPTA